MKNMTQNPSKNQISTEVLTHKIYYEDPCTKQVKTHYCTSKQYLAIRRTYDRKTSIDLGNGKTIVWMQFKGGDRIDPQEQKHANHTYFTRQTCQRIFRDNCEYEALTFEVLDKQTKKIFKTETEEKLIKQYSAEDISRYRKFASAIRNRNRTGESISDILKQFLNF